MIPRRVLVTTAAVALAVGFILEGERALVERCRNEVAVCPVVTLEAPERRDHPRNTRDAAPPSQESTDQSGRVPDEQ
jgi:hypothetical protein